MKQINSQKLQDTLRKKFLKSGVKMSGPETIFFSSDTKVGKNVTIEPYVVIGKNVKIGNNCIIAGQVGFAGSSTLGNNVMIGGQAGISGHLKVGNNVQIGGGSGVIKDVPENSKVMGYTAKDLKRFIKENK